MSDESGAAEAVEAPESGTEADATAEPALSIEERVESLEQGLAAVAAGGAGMSAEVTKVAVEIHRRIDRLAERVGELGDRVERVLGLDAEAVHAEELHGDPTLEELAEGDAAEPIEGDPCPVCGALLKRAAMDVDEGEPIRCQRCGATHTGTRG